MHSSPNRLAVSVTLFGSPKGRHMILDSRFWILDCGLKKHESHCRKRLRGERGSSSIAFMRGSGRGHAFSDTWETWMVAKVLNPVPRKRGGWGDQDQEQGQQEGTHSLGRGRSHPLSGIWEKWMALNVIAHGRSQGEVCDDVLAFVGGQVMNRQEDFIDSLTDRQLLADEEDAGHRFPGVDAGVSEARDGLAVMRQEDPPL